MAVMQTIKSGISVGNGAAINVELGWIPDRVDLFNATDGTLFSVGFLEKVIPFTSGGTTEIVAGDTIYGATTVTASAKIKQVLLYSGSWAGGDAAGFFLVNADDLIGTFGSENVRVGAGTNDATVTVQVDHTLAIAAAAASATGNAAITAYVGSAGTNSKGFTIGSTLAVEAKVLRWTAFRDGNN